MLRKTSLMILSLLLLVSCTTPPEPREIVQTRVVERDIPIQPRPRSVELSDVKWNVVNQENLESFLEEKKIAETDEFVFMAISVRDYEKLSLNLDELRRYITQQKEIIVYYEESIRNEE